MFMSLFASIGARVRVGFILLLAIMISVAAIAYIAASESGERAAGSIDAYEILAAAKRVSSASSQYFAEQSDAAADETAAALADLDVKLGAIEGVAPERLTGLRDEHAVLAESFAAARASDATTARLVDELQREARDLRAVSADLTAMSEAALATETAELARIDEQTVRVNMLDALTLSVRREATAFMSEFAIALTPDMVTDLSEMRLSLNSIRHALERIASVDLTPELRERYETVVEAYETLAAAFERFETAMEPTVVLFRSFRDTRRDVVEAADALKSRIAIFERDIQVLKRNQMVDLRTAREAAAAAVEATRAGAAFGESTAAMEAAFLGYVLEPSEERFDAALGALQPLIGFILTVDASDTDAFAALNDGVAILDAGLVSLQAAYSERTAAVDAMRAASARFSDIATAFGSEEMAASVDAANDVGALLVWATGGAAFIAIIISWRVTRSITRPVRRLTGQMKEIAGGDLAVALTDAGRKDEIGEMAAAVEVFRDNGLKMRELAAAEEERDAASEAERRQMMAELQDAFGGVVNAAASGDLHGRVEARFADPELNSVAGGMNSVLETVGGFLADLRTSLDALAEGDLSGRIASVHQGAFNEMADSANATMTKLSGLIEEIRSASRGLAGSTEEMAQSARSLSERTVTQASSLKQTATTLDEMRDAVGANAQTAEAANELAHEMRRKAESGGGVVTDAKEAMARLSDSAARITEIIGVIDGIAFQTNLLALNAAVEAARAGESGKGFAVVASEVRALAQRSADAAQDIKALIAESTQQVDDGVRLVEATRATLEDISGAVSEVSDQMNAITTATREQATSVQEASDAVNALNDLTAQNAKAAEQSVSAAQVFSAEMTRMDKLVATFKLAEADARDEDAA